jgi:hypothetical protein
VPAHELEIRVTEKLVVFLKSDADVFDRLSEEGESLAISRNRVAAAKKLSARLPSLPSDDLRDLLACFLQRVIIQENCIEVIIRRKDLGQLLENGGKIMADSLSGKRTPVDVNDLISLIIEARRKRFGGEVHLVVCPAEIRQCSPVLSKELGECNAIMSRGFGHRGLTFAGSLETAFGASNKRVSRYLCSAPYLRPMPACIL